ncbi:Positive regulator of CheA protein activity (CheW) [hydrothermal vent metagenome]|uniref:Positive regulator of CheA protein activity (CheW) n=1 Tax=hydrothermal vent metagenome TaxID=652676 RepID=A0A3B1DDA1_9ZZZZ
MTTTLIENLVASNLDQYVSFWLGDQLLGVPVTQVQEVLNAQSIARTPKARSEIAGLVNLRGQIVTAVNLRKRMGLTDFENDEECMNVVFRFKGESYSLLVDEVGDVIDVPSETLEPVPQTLDDCWKKVTMGVFQLEERLLIILNVEAILDF